MIATEDGKYFCEKCKEELDLNYTYDAYFCKKCDEWAEKTCGDPKCDYCVDRPEKPSMV